MKNSQTKPGLRWPRPYLSWSQFSLWTRGSSGPDAYIKKYLYKDPEYTNRAMQVGRQMADMLMERDKETDDPILEHYRMFLPNYGCNGDLPGQELQTTYAGIPLLSKPDGYNPPIIRPESPSIKETVLHNGELGEYKTGRLWTQARADEHEQIDFYLLVWQQIWHTKPKTILHWMPTIINGAGMPEPTGAIVNFETSRSDERLTIFGGKLIRAWREIGQRCATEYAAIGL